MSFNDLHGERDEYNGSSLESLWMGDIQGSEERAYILERQRRRAKRREREALEHHDLGGEG